MRTVTSKGIICVRDRFDIEYRLCEIVYEVNENDSFHYTFRPNYSVIDLLEDDVFQGIPGLDLDTKKEQFIRKNVLPVFISERVPSEKREDYYELLEKAGMEYMDPIEYLIRNKQRYSGDRLYVVRWEAKEETTIDDGFSYLNTASFIKRILLSLGRGDNVLYCGQMIDDSNRGTVFRILKGIYSRSLEAQKLSQRKGIMMAEEQGIYKGRKPKKVETYKVLEMFDNVEKKKITAREAAKALGISIDKYYRLRKQLQK